MIRIAQESDLSAMLEIYAPYVMETTYSFEYTVPSQQAFRERFLKTTARFPWLVWEEHGTVLGYAYASAPWSRQAYSWTAESSIYLLPQAQGRGVGTALYKELERILAELGYRVNYAVIAGENTGSIAFHERVGYQTIGLFPDCGFKLGRWVSVVWMEKRLRPLGEPKVEPNSWDGRG